MSLSYLKKNSALVVITIYASVVVVTLTFVELPVAVDVHSQGVVAAGVVVYTGQIGHADDGDDVLLSEKNARFSLFCFKNTEDRRFHEVFNSTNDLTAK